MATYGKLLYTPSFSSQSPQIFKKPGFTGENSKHHKLSWSLNRLTQEATPSPLLHIKSPEITPCFSRKMKTNHLLRFYSNIRTYQKSSVNLRAPEGGKSQRAKRDARGGACGPQPMQSFKTHRFSYHSVVYSRINAVACFLCAVCVCVCVKGPHLILLDSHQEILKQQQRIWWVWYSV